MRSHLGRSRSPLFWPVFMEVACSTRESPVPSCGSYIYRRPLCTSTLVALMPRCLRASLDEGSNYTLDSLTILPAIGRWAYSATITTLSKNTIWVVGFDVLVESLKLASDRNPNVLLVVVGSSESATLTFSLAGSLDVKGRRELANPCY